MGRGFVLDSSRRARGFALYATLRSLGREGIAHLAGRAAMRVSVSNWSTSEADVERTGRAIPRAAREVQEVGR